MSKNNLKSLGNSAQGGLIFHQNSRLDIDNKITLYHI